MKTGNENRKLYPWLTGILCTALAAGGFYVWSETYAPSKPVTLVRANTKPSHQVDLTGKYPSTYIHSSVGLTEAGPTGLSTFSGAVTLSDKAISHTTSYTNNFPGTRTLYFEAKVHQAELRTVPGQTGKAWTTTSEIASLGDEKMDLAVGEQGDFSWSWDKTDAKGHKVSPGMYVVWENIYFVTPDGKEPLMGLPYYLEVK